jgi:hypothetical protein
LKVRPIAVSVLVLSLAALLGGCGAAADDELEETTSEVEESLKLNDTPTCKEGETLCCRIYTCNCIPEKNTCFGGMGVNAQ